MVAPSSYAAATLTRTTSARAPGSNVANSGGGCNWLTMSIVPVPFATSSFQSGPQASPHSRRVLISSRPARAKSTGVWARAAQLIARRWVPVLGGNSALDVPPRCIYIGVSGHSIDVASSQKKGRQTERRSGRLEKTVTVWLFGHLRPLGGPWTLGKRRDMWHR